MEAIFKIRANQIDHGFIDSIKKMFKEKDLIIRITVTEDETEYLASNEFNEKHILENMVAETSIRFTEEEFKNYVSQTI